MLARNEAAEVTLKFVRHLALVALHLSAVALHADVLWLYIGVSRRFGSASTALPRARLVRPSGHCC